MTTSINYEVLLTILDISQGPMTTERLAMRRAVGERTIKSYIAKAREMGADIRSKKSDGAYYWHLVNFLEIEDRVLTWLEFEEKGLK